MTDSKAKKLAKAKDIAKTEPHHVRLNRVLKGHLGIGESVDTL